MTNKLVWVNPSRSSLGDRLIDVMLLSTLAKLIDADLHFEWLDAIFEYGVFGENQRYQHTDGEFKPWDKVRFEDYKIENWSQYFNLPSNIKINQPVENNDKTFIFPEYLGGIYSPHKFYELFAYRVSDWDKFYATFKQTMKEFTPTEKLLNLVSNYPKPDISVHLRRTDKIRVLAPGNDQVCMNTEMLDNLNNMTEEVINKLNKGDKKIFFASDDDNESKRYQSKYTNFIEKTSMKEIEKTYVDLYLLSISEYIILSQVHSNFSVLASFMNDAKLVYLYQNTMIDNMEFNKLENFIYYKNIS